ncbi:hypothetical protein [Facilibium subflavum]|uniref:hypothetical protein n=1 Tax=Facilibium subflavum TaxID=2219058 RepID=UPI000E6510DF|nr:hypothetical protein [Facilibium subflavum]
MSKKKVADKAEPLEILNQSYDLKALFDDEPDVPADEMVAEMLNGVVKASVELTKLIIEKDPTINTKDAILKTYQESLERTFSTLTNVGY